MDKTREIHRKMGEGNRGGKNTLKIVESKIIYFDTPYQ